MSKIHDKIRKLLALAEGNSSESEAEAATEQAMRLLAEHNLSLSEIARSEDAAQMEQRTLDLRYADPWRRSIVFDAARLYLCEALNTEIPEWVTSRRTGRKTLRFRRAYVLIGKPHNLDVAESMIRYLVDTVVRLSREHSPERKRQLPFQRGCGERLAERCYQLRKRAETQPAASVDGETISGLPALYSTELTVVKEFMESTIEITKMRTGSSDLSGGDALAGAEAADDVNLGDQLPEASDTRLLS